MAEGGDAGLCTRTRSFPSEDYECKICYNRFDLDLHAPKLLGCSHTFCRQCLDALHSREGRGWRISCPVCRHRTPLPEYRVHNLPDNTAVSAALPLQDSDRANSDPEDHHTGASVCPATSRDRDYSCRTCRRVGLTTSIVCAVLSILSMVVLLLLGLIFVHNFKNVSLPVGAVCLVVASALAPFSIILIWLTCLLYRPETESGNSNGPVT